MTERQRATEERKKKKIPTCLGLNRQSISVDPGGGRHRWWKWHSTKGKRKKEMLYRIEKKALSVFLKMYIFSFFPLQVGSERINRDVNRDKHKTENSLYYKLLFGVTRLDLSVPFHQILARVLPISRETADPVTRGCTLDDIDIRVLYQRLLLFLWEEVLVSILSRRISENNNTANSSLFT